MSSVLRHFGLSLRTLGKSPGTSALAVLVLGLAIGANSAMFSVVNTLVLKPIERMVKKVREVLRAIEASTAYPESIGIG